MLQYGFMQKALFAGILFGIMLPCIGVVIVLKRLSMVGDALSHISLAGVAGGMLMGIHPVTGAVLTCISAGFGIEWMRRRFKAYEELSIALTMSFGVGLAGVLSGFVKNAGSFHQFLFGSIVAITSSEMWIICVMSIFVIVVFSVFYHELMIYAFDEDTAKLKKVKSSLIQFVFTLLTAGAVAVASKIIGALLVSSMMVIPVACALQIAKSYKETLLYSIAFAQCFLLLGLILSFYFNLKPGGSTVLLGIFTLVGILITKNLRGREKKDD